MSDNEKWWRSLSLIDKVRVASWIEGIKIHYPFCTKAWNKLTEQQKSVYRERLNKYKVNIDYGEQN